MEPLEGLVSYGPIRLVEPEQPKMSMSDLWLVLDYLLFAKQYRREMYILHILLSCTRDSEVLWPEECGS